MIKPRTKVPDLHLDLINDTHWKIAEQDPEKYTLIVFYRGLHCPVCKSYLEELTDKMEDFVERGVNLIAISMDSEEKAKKAGEEWEVTSLPIGFNLSQDKAKEYGLYLSKGISEKEPELFSEPAVFLIKPDKTLYFSAIQTMPFARPDFQDILNAIDFVQKKDYPARGEV
ncbi:AhpC/TSA family protein [Aquimarina sp. ERC-38]|uniref:peroxiredoxin-like family protein n=1 Tax=Aquimarina sp. ERC-38 TaxID=2949996 RepID=UPI0022484A0E|nr:peroxiredoxin-like family protein [Aquimarina sp. ERC-38]UZO79478.1 AhpC/TSA family protein [Aquimarina sp. ERC-38]